MVGYVYATINKDTSLFEDQHKYNAIMSALADVVYREMRMG